jgi:ribosomal protein S10
MGVDIAGETETIVRRDYAGYSVEYLKAARESIRHQMRMFNRTIDLTAAETTLTSMIREHNWAQFVDVDYTITGPPGPIEPGMST